MKKEEIYAIIEKYGLKPASQRELSLFMASSVAQGYCVLLKKEMCSMYAAVGVIGDGMNVRFLFNEGHTIEQTKKFVEDNSGDVSFIFSRAKEIFKDSEKKFFEADEKGNAIGFLKVMTETVPNYISSIGIYNCFRNYLGDAGGNKGLSEELIEQIGRERDEIAKLYPEIDKKVKFYSEIVGKEKGFDGDLLMYLTLDEMKSYVLDKKISPEKLEELAERREGYFYLSDGVEEHVFSEIDDVQEIKDRLLNVKTDVDILEGHGAYPGKIRGVVYNKLFSKGEVPEGDFILVTHMTHPKDIQLIQKAMAIVTDEGGVLSHAAIVSRELKKPCVLSTKIGTKVLKTGDLIEVDADKGIVRKIK